MQTEQTKMRKWVLSKVESGEDLIDTIRKYINVHDYNINVVFDNGASAVVIKASDGSIVCSGAAEGSGIQAVEDFLRAVFLIPEAKTREKITAEQLHYLTAYCTPEEIEATMRKRGVNDIRDLPRDYADRLILRIAEKRMKRHE